MYRRQNCHHGYMYPLVSASRTLLRTCIRRHVAYPSTYRRTEVARPGYLCKRDFISRYKWIQLQVDMCRRDENFVADTGYM